MSDARWLDVEADVEGSVHHFARAVEIHERGGYAASGLDGYVDQMALMHAMQAGYTSLEAALLKILDLLGEDAPSGANWHQDLVRRCARALDGPFARPAILSEEIVPDVEEARRFRHRATHAYDGFDGGRAAPSIEAAGRLSIMFPAGIEAFRRTIDSAR